MNTQNFWLERAHVAERRGDLAATHTCLARHHESAMVTARARGDGAAAELHRNRWRAANEDAKRAAAAPARPATRSRPRPAPTAPARPAPRRSASAARPAAAAPRRSPELEALVADTERELAAVATPAARAARVTLAERMGVTLAGRGRVDASDAMRLTLGRGPRETGADPKHEAALRAQILERRSRSYEALQQIQRARQTPDGQRASAELAARMGVTEPEPRTGPVSPDHHRLVLNGGSAAPARVGAGVWASRP